MTWYPHFFRATDQGIPPKLPEKQHGPQGRSERFCFLPTQPWIHGTEKHGFMGSFRPSFSVAYSFAVSFMWAPNKQTNMDHSSLLKHVAVSFTHFSCEIPSIGNSMGEIPTNGPFRGKLHPENWQIGTLRISTTPCLLKRENLRIQQIEVIFTFSSRWLVFDFSNVSESPRKSLKNSCPQKISGSSNLIPSMGRTVYLYTYMDGGNFYGFHVDVSKNRGTPKWMVYNGKTLLKWMIWGFSHIFGGPPM